MTKEQYEKLLPYEQHFFTAVNGDYARNVTLHGFEVMNEVYKELFGKDSGMVTGCNRCRLHGLKDLAKEFYKCKKALEAKQTAEEFENKSQVVGNKQVKKTKATDKKLKTQKK